MNKSIVVISLVFFVSLGFAKPMIPQQIELEGQNLKLNGTGTRTKFFFDIYSGALYTSKKVKSLQDILATGKNVRVAMHILYNRISTEKFRKGWQEGFDKNLNQSEKKRFAAEIKQFENAFFTAFKGDVINIDFISSGVRVSHNGKIRAQIMTPDFKEMVLRIWFGKHPADDDLEEGMLGKN